MSLLFITMAWLARGEVIRFFRQPTALSLLLLPLSFRDGLSDISHLCCILDQRLHSCAADLVKRMAQHLFPGVCSLGTVMAWIAYQLAIVILGMVFATLECTWEFLLFPVACTLWYYEFSLGPVLCRQPASLGDI
ncbi:hypothetical protein F4678DRAFT_58578 [Xylaria arbuscula]|nr:hypothetical protein F4678DRAFT_58578 [Xylaria arbuscula]